MSPRRSPGAVLHVAEPPAAYARRPRLVVDTTVIAAHVFGEEHQALAVATLQARALDAPHLIDYEMASVALKKMRRERRPAPAVLAALDLFAELPLERHPVDVREVLSLAERYSLTAYDGAYLWLADRLEAPLATFDAKLAEAARRHLGGPARDAAAAP
jgi:predicted nucleic acid-binding protein